MEVLETLNAFVWGAPALLLILGVGLYLSFRTGFVQFRLFPQALKRFFDQFNINKNTKSSYRSLCTALAATVGIGNIIGVAGAILIGGPGAVFWIWICALLGMITKFAEATLAVRYRCIGPEGELSGGPMYMIRCGLPYQWHWLSGVYCLFGIVAAFGVGNTTQVSAAVSGLDTVIVHLGWRPSVFIHVAVGCVLAITVYIVLSGGGKRISRVSQVLVPITAVGYLLLCLVVLILRANSIPVAFAMIFSGAFSPRAVTGGVLGSAFVALRVGASRGTFTNEAGMGTAAIAHAWADVDHPVEQGLMGIIEVFLDTIVICTMTALVILCSGIKLPYGNGMGESLTADAFSAVIGSGVCIPLAISIILFAVATIFGWGFYGIHCAQYLFGKTGERVFILLQSVVTFIGAVTDTKTVWMIAELFNGLMAIPNLVALVGLAPELIRLCDSYKIRQKSAVLLDKDYTKMVK